MISIAETLLRLAIRAGIRGYDEPEVAFACIISRLEPSYYRAALMQEFHDIRTQVRELRDGMPQFALYDELNRTEERAALGEVVA